MFCFYFRSFVREHLSKIFIHLILRLDVFCLELLEAFDCNVGDQGVQFVDGVFIVVATAREANAYAERWISTNNPNLVTDTRLNTVTVLPDTTAPDRLVQAGVDSHILGVHLLLGELADDLDGSGRALLETDGVKTLVEVNGALACHNLIDCGLGAFLGLAFGHFAEPTIEES